MANVETMNYSQMESVFYDEESDPLAFKRWLGRARAEQSGECYSIAVAIAARRLFSFVEKHCDCNASNMDQEHKAEALEVCQLAVSRFGDDDRLIEIIEDLA